jgi:hypothetical protein
MITQSKSRDALLALNAVLVQARLMALEQVHHEVIARVLDVAEVLPMLIAREDRDCTAEFRDHLENLAQLDEGFGQALQRFDGRHDL